MTGEIQLGVQNWERDGRNGILALKRKQKVAFHQRHMTNIDDLKSSYFSKKWPDNAEWILRCCDCLLDTRANGWKGWTKRLVVWFVS